MTLSEFLGQFHTEREAIEKTLEQLREVVGSSVRLSAPTCATPANDYETTQQRLEEYKFLRVELEAIWGQTYSTLNFILAVIGLIITAAYGTSGDPIILLPMASIVTFGAYRLIEIHTTRVWRIVGYMRCALEANLKGIRWETRLAQRHSALKKMKKTRFDSNIFDGHVLVLDAMNGALLVGIWFSGFLGHSELVTKVSSGIARIWIVMASSFFPLLFLLRSLFVRKQLKRGDKIEAEHLLSWHCDDESGKPVSQAEPPSDWKAYLKSLAP